MRRGTTSTLTVACVVSLAAASCATVIGLDQVSRVDCAADCGVDGAEDDALPAGDATMGEATVGDAAGDRPGSEGSTCVSGQACDGGRCDDAGVCRPQCRSNADCEASSPVCDLATSTCVPCLPQSDTCARGTICVAQGGSYACVPGCETVADCAEADAGESDAGDGDAPATIACCNQTCTDTARDTANCGVCGKVCPGGATAACVRSECAYTIGGTLGGLPAAATIVLQDDMADDLTLTTNGPFTFTKRVATGSPYDVTVQTTPAGQTCSVTSGSGTVAGADVSGVAVTCMSCYAPGSQTFTYTGALQSWTVPCGVTSVTLTVDGAAGAPNAEGNVAGGKGGTSTGTLAVTAGAVLEVFVGGAATTTVAGWNGGGAGGTGSAGCSGGGGGGASDVRVTPYALANRVIVAGGGGGGGGDRISMVGAGAGGGGGGGYFGGGGGESWGGAGGGAASVTMGGIAGCGSGCTGVSTCGAAGTSGTGGNGGNVTSSSQDGTQVGGAAGGGGGDSGGAGASGGPCGTNYSGGGGGGGSGYVGGVTGGATTAGTHAGNGQVTITW